MRKGLRYWLGVFIRTLRPVPGYPNPRYVPPPPQYRYLWWILDPTHTNHCEDCKRIAAGSPYARPGSGGNELYQTCGDGRTHCGADCTCNLSFFPPGSLHPDIPQEPMSPERDLLKYFTHGQVWYLQCHPDLWKQVTGTTDRRKWPRNVPEMSREERASYP